MAENYNVSVTLGAMANTGTSSASATSFGVTATNGQIQILSDIATLLVQNYSQKADITSIVSVPYKNTVDINSSLDELSGISYQMLSDIKSELSVYFGGDYTLTVDIVTEINNPVDGNYTTTNDIGVPLGFEYVNQGDVKTNLIT